MNTSQRDERGQDLGLLFLRIRSCLFLLGGHGLPKLLNYSAQLQVIKDPLHLGENVTLTQAFNVRFAGALRYA